MNIIFSFPGNKRFGHLLANKLHIEEGDLTIKKFPDGESYVRINSSVQNKVAILFCTLNKPDQKIVPLMFAANTLKELGAKKIILISPYLPYMRQDKRFKAGEAVSSQLFATFLSNCVDYLITIDPHLHRIPQLSTIYTIPVMTLHATKDIAQRIKKNIRSPFLIGPDGESEQWVSEIARELKAPFVVCKKNRISANDVNIEIPPFSITNETLILLDDIISTGSSMIEILKKLSLQGNRAVCIAIHPLLNKKIKNKLYASGATEIITSNTILNNTNKIDLMNLIGENLKKIISEDEDYF